MLGGREAGTFLPTYTSSGQREASDLDTLLSYMVTNH
jgi:hypothetical protein